MKLEVVTPEENMGDVIGDLNQRRGQVEGMESSRSGARIVKAMRVRTFFVDAPVVGSSAPPSGREPNGSMSAVLSLIHIFWENKPSPSGACW